MDTLSLTYQELADRLGLEREAARQLVKRRRWMKWKGNDGQVRISIPEEAISDRVETGLKPDKDRAAEPVDDRSEPGLGPVLNRHIERLEQALETAQKRADELERERNEERDRATTAEKTVAVISAQVDALNTVLVIERERAAERLEAERRQADERLAAERQRAEDWKLAADRFASQAEKITEAATTMRRPWWRRLAG